MESGKESAADLAAEGLTFPTLIFVTLAIVGLFFLLLVAIYWLATPQTLLEEELGLSETGFLAGLLAQSVAIFCGL